MTTEIIGGISGLKANVDENNNFHVFETVPGYPAAGGFYTVAGKSGAVAIAAALASDTSLMSARMAVGSTRRAYITGLQVNMSICTPGAAGGVPSALGLHRFTSATPTGGTPRTVCRLGPTKGTTTDMTDVRDNNAALTVTNVIFTDDVDWSITPTSGTSTVPIQWIFLPKAPLELGPGDGIALRTDQVGPATATWYFSYTLAWFER